MPKRKESAHVFELAKRGAEARWQDIVHEAQMLIELFPHLRDSVDKDELPIPFIIRRGAKKAARKGWTPEQRKAAALRMKKYWAKKRKVN